MFAAIGRYSYSQRLPRPGLLECRPLPMEPRSSAAAIRGVIRHPLGARGRGPARGDPTVFLPEAFARLQAARYVPSDEDQAWTGWIGAGADL